MKTWTKAHKRYAQENDRVPCKLQLNLNVIEPGLESRKALGGLGNYEYVGSVTPSQAERILAILDEVTAPTMKVEKL